MKRVLSIVKREVFVVFYVLLLMLMLVKVGEVNKITTYNISGVNYLMSSHLVTEYKEEPGKVSYL